MSAAQNLDTFPKGIDRAMDYSDFIDRKQHNGALHGFAPLWMPSRLFPFQEALAEWALRKGRAAVFADCGLGKTPIQLTWAENVARKTNGRVLILTPLAVAFQTVREGDKFGVEVKHRREGIEAGDRIVVTNYERLHYFNPEDFAGVVCDESSILKHYSGATQSKVTRFLTKVQYRALFTATAAPNDWVELGTSSEALGEMSNSDMLTRFFRQLDDKGQKKAMREQREAEGAIQHYKRLAFRVSQNIGQWRLKNYAVADFWRWVASWARACRMPSDLGFCDDGFVLPPLTEQDHIIAPDKPPEGWLFTVPAFGRKEELAERRRMINQRCEYVANLATHDAPVVVWCHLNQEGDMLEKLIPGSVQVKGATPDDEKERIYTAFSNGSQRALIIKPKIGAWGLNWQHCSHVVTFASHSYEQYYQSIRRCWRFGQKNPVRLDVVSTEGEIRVIANMRRKADQAAAMFAELVRYMNQGKTQNTIKNTEKEELPTWL